METCLSFPLDFPFHVLRVLFWADVSPFLTVCKAVLSFVFIHSTFANISSFHFLFIEYTFINVFIKLSKPFVNSL